MYKTMDLKKLIVIYAGCLCLILFACCESGNATPFNPAKDATSDQLSGLETFFAGIGSSIDPYKDERGAEVFQITGPASSAWLMHYGYSGTASVEFGFYNIHADLSNLEDEDLLELFSTTYSVTGDLKCVFDDQTGTFYSYKPGFPNNTQIDSADYMPAFGFYLNIDGHYYFSQNKANENETDYFLTYQGVLGDSITLAGSSYMDTPQHWYIAAEATDGNLFDFDEIVVRTESMQPVPEPATIMLMGAGLVGFSGFVRRKRRSKRN